MDPLIDARSLHSILDTPELVVVDCRFDLLDAEAGHQRYLEGHVPGARYANLDTQLAAPRAPGDGRHPLPAPERCAQTFRALGISRSSRVVAYDDSGGAVAARLWWMLRWLGHIDTAVLDGGIAAWTEAGFALETAVRAPAQGDFGVTHVEARDVVETAELEQLLAAGAAVLDARAPARFYGEAEPIDPVAGHVPDAVNMPFTQLLASDGRFAAPAALRERFEAALGEHEPDDAVAMCGSGVTACHLLLGMARAGLGRGRLYAGSWSAWITDPRRPVARGEAGPYE